jgi:hypothetical protein
MLIKKYINLLLALILLALIGVATYYYIMSNRLSISNSQLNESEKVELEELIEKVGMLIKLPSDETPTIATVSDLEQLKDQPFFAKAKVGDKVLMYPKSQKAYLYDVENNKILEVAPIALEPQVEEDTTPETRVTDTKSR